MALEISILVGTMTGTARMVAQELELAFADDDVAIKVILMDGLDYRIFSQPGAFLIRTSTYGQGDVPDNAKALYADLLARRPDLSSVRYGVFALGDRTHVGTFCFGGKRFDEALSALGARRCGSVLEHNASGAPARNQDKDLRPCPRAARLLPTPTTRCRRHASLFPASTTPRRTWSSATSPRAAAIGRHSSTTQAAIRIGNCPRASIAAPTRGGGSDCAWKTVLRFCFMTASISRRRSSARSARALCRYPSTRC
ncbi:MAG: hypothetical protein E6H74_01025 [Betaproteobacteria bacterium]|nr:MAG: hypothetical protein E6H74_01025 [Betaproteobacteria bacterium]